MMHGRKNKESCALKLVVEIILYYDARSKKHQITEPVFILSTEAPLTRHLHICTAYIKLGISNEKKTFCWKHLQIFPMVT